MPLLVSRVIARRYLAKSKPASFATLVAISHWISRIVENRAMEIRSTNFYSKKRKHNIVILRST